MDDDRYAGMTTNERLFDAGLLDAFEAAARSRDRGAMIEILSRVMPPSEAEAVSQTILESPAVYGF